MAMKGAIRRAAGVLNRQRASASPTRDNPWNKLRIVFEKFGGTIGEYVPVKAVVDGLVECLKTLESASQGQQEFQDLRNELEEIVTELQQNFSSVSDPTISSSIEKICITLQQEINQIIKRQARTSTGRYAEAEADREKILVSYRQVRTSLQRLSTISSIATWMSAEKHAKEDRIKILNPSNSATYNSYEKIELGRRGCTPGTRTTVLSRILGWAYAPAMEPIFWMNGMAGTGKTTIAYSVSQALSQPGDLHALAASFFCSRSIPECRDVRLIIPSIASQLAKFSRPFQHALSRVIQKDADAHTRHLESQFDELIVNPLNEVREVLPTHMVVIIDALDECENKQATRLLLKTILSRSSHLPIKFLISSRPEPAIRDQMSDQSGDLVWRMVLHELDTEEIQDDIKTYLASELAPMNLSNSELESLVQRAGILFIYAATVARYVSYDNFSRNSRARLDTVVSLPHTSENTLNGDIDKLYSNILQAALNDSGLRDIDREDVLQVLHTVICAQAPLTVDTLSGLLNMNDTSRIHAALRPLWSVLHITGASELVTILHASFSDYMLDRERAAKFYCEAGTHHRTLVRLCFDCIEAAPSFNICQLESSYILDKDVNNIRDRVSKRISLQLWYSCQFWTNHLYMASETEDRYLEARLQKFLSTRLLLWLEVMNLNQLSSTAVECTHRAKEWAIEHGSLEDLQYLTNDAWRFTTTFACHPVSQSTPHIYTSMLAFWPEFSPISRCYANQLRGMIGIRGTAMDRRQSAFVTSKSMGAAVRSVAFSPNGKTLAIGCNTFIHIMDAFSIRPLNARVPAHNAQILSIAFSPDGARLVSSSKDATVCVWDTRSWLRVLGPLTGHKGGIEIVRFSPDGTLIISGSNDKTIRIWDAQSGYPVLSPLTGHSKCITSVAVSPSGVLIASGSGDESIRVWETQTGGQVLNPLVHRSYVTSVVFSPDETRIYSGADDSTIKGWNVENGNLILGPLVGHSGAIRCIAVSNQNQGQREGYLASGSDDCTVRVWDPTTGEILFGPFKSHSHLVRSIAFSPDNARIVSGSKDGLVCLWDLRTPQRTRTFDALPGHTKQIKSLDISPDGTRLLSGAIDRTICVWDLESRELVLGPLRGHKDHVISVCFSPDGSRFASGSHDTTIRVWETRTGRNVFHPLKGHTNWVKSVAYSPNSRTIVSGSDDRTIRLWDAIKGEIILGPLEGHKHYVLTVKFSPDGKQIVSGSADDMVHVWDAENGQLVRVLDGCIKRVNAMAFSPDCARIVSGSFDKTIRIRDASTGHLTLGSLETHTRDVTSVRFSANGTHIVSGSEDKTICVWNAQSGESVTELLRGHTSSIRSVVCLPDGTRVVSASDDSVIRVWDICACPMTKSPYNDWVLGKDGWVQQVTGRGGKLQEFNAVLSTWVS
ncbi:unnamed protein product [Rhizoctonia solani]|uniref:NACHT domain-containing protein n=1 Tax=Rhizoctonia solani TaxID=456999 RepID=A0A8H2XCX3_9AGAM|nr:unnamed protein product [Rhizoctonia solani]